MWAILSMCELLWGEWFLLIIGLSLLMTRFLLNQGQHLSGYRALLWRQVLLYFAVERSPAVLRQYLFGCKIVYWGVSLTWHLLYQENIQKCALMRGATVVCHLADNLDHISLNPTLSFEDRFNCSVRLPACMLFQDICLNARMSFEESYCCTLPLSCCRCWSFMSLQQAGRSLNKQTNKNCNI